MPLPVIANTFRVTWHVEGFSGSANNVMHFSAASGDESDLGDAIDTVLGTLAADTHLYWPMSGSCSISHLEILALDGSSASVGYDLTNVQSGATSGNIVPQLAGVVSLRTLLRGQSGRGRVYLGPCADDTFDGTAHMDATGHGLCQTAWEAFFVGMLAASKPLVVASYVNASVTGVGGVIVRSYPGTQRRRARFLQRS